MQYWKRQYKISFPSIGYAFSNINNRNGLKIEFDIDKDLTKETNKSVLKIYNLNNETRKALEKSDILCEIYAGYEKTTGPVKIFVGNTLQVHTKNSGKDVITEFRLADGGTAIRDCEISLSYPPSFSVCPAFPCASLLVYSSDTSSVRCSTTTTCLKLSSIS